MFLSDNVSAAGLFKPNLIVIMAHFLALDNESYKALLTFFFWKKWNYLKHEHTGVVVSNY